MARSLFLLLCAGLLVASPAFAERTQIYSLSGMHCADCGKLIGKSIKGVKGVKKVSFDYLTAEATVTMSDAVTDDAVVAAIRNAGTGEHFDGVPGAGQGAYIPFPDYPKGTDVLQLTANGSAVGPLEKARAAGKYTVFDVYADWCMPCRAIDETLRDLAAKRTDVAFRRLNVVSFTSPLAKELGSSLKALPYVVVFAPDGTKTALAAPSSKKLLAALGTK